MKTIVVFMTIIFLFLPGFSPVSAENRQQNEEKPSFLEDRDQIIPTSMFGTYINRGELLFYPFFEFYSDHNAEYSPDDLGYDLDKDFRGKYRGCEGLIFLGYGLTSNISIEFEAAMMDATLETDPNDPTGVPAKISESGLGDVQMQLNWLWRKETVKKAGFFSYAEVVFPFTKKDKTIIGTTDWEFKVGTGVVRGFSWGTMVVRVAVEYEMAENKFDIGEVAIEYLKRLSRHWKAYVGVEGTQDEIELITEFQWHLSKKVFVKLNNAFGVTSKATDWAPEIGIMFRL